MFKYPILRPVWENKKDDAHYFVIKIDNGGANIQMVKGVNWIGYEGDK
jgi:hypothetical protein